MPTYAQLDDEAAWRDEIEPPALLVLKRGIKAHYPTAGVGIKGDNRHLNGYHRSRRWIRESRFCTNRTYSVSRTPGDRSGGNENWCCAFDIWGISQAELHAMCRRLDVAVRAGRLEKVVQWYGNFGGDDRVDGFDNITDRLASSDSSHLTHLHLSLDRGRANEDHSDLLAVLNGDDDDMFEQRDRNTATADTWRTITLLENRDTAEYQLPGEPKPRREVNGLKKALDALQAAAAADETRDAVMLAAIKAIATNGGPEAAPIVAAIKAEGEATRTLVEQRHQVEMAALNREHAAEMAGLKAELDRLESTATSVEGGARTSAQPTS